MTIIERVAETFDFSRLFEGSAEAEIIPADQVPSRLRELADQLERSGKPRLVLREVHSLQSTFEYGLAYMTLVLRVGRFFGPTVKIEGLRQD
jgi:hypothetical protein